MGFIARRTLWAIPVLLLMILLTFLLLKPLPGSPFGGPKVPPSVKDRLEESYGLNDPWYVQYVNYVRGVATGDLGPSYSQRPKEVADIIAERLPRSAAVGAVAILVAALLGVALGVVSAMRARGFLDYLILIATMAGFALPSFVIATFWVYFVSYQWGLTPVYGWRGPQYWIGPVAVLALSVLPYFVRLVRAAMLETYNEEFVNAARAKGLPERTTVVRHVLRNSLIPVLTNAAPLVGYMVTGSFIVEAIFGVPGIGSAFVDSVTSRDYPLILGTAIVFAAIIIVLNMVVDIVYGLLDPRVRVQ